MTPIQQQIADEAARQGVRPELALAIARRESSFNPNAIGDGGRAVGLFQLHAGAAQDAGITPDQRYDTAANIRAGVTYLRQLIDRFGNEEQALQAYNGGPTNVARGTVSSAAESYAAAALREAAALFGSWFGQPASQTPQEGPQQAASAAAPPQQAAAPYNLAWTLGEQQQQPNDEAGIVAPSMLWFLGILGTTIGAIFLVSGRR